MRDCVKEKAEVFRQLNDLALREEIVIFGSTYMANFPFYELINKCKLENAVYNRSIEGLTVQEAETILTVSVLDINPRKVFLCFDAEEIAEERLLAEHIHAALPNAKIYLVTLPRDEDCGEHASEMEDAFRIRLTTAETSVNGFSVIAVAL